MEDFENIWNTLEVWKKKILNKERVVVLNDDENLFSVIIRRARRTKLLVEFGTPYVVIRSESSLDLAIVVIMRI